MAVNVLISLRRFTRNSQPRSKGSWTFPVPNFIRIESKMQKIGSNVNLSPYIKVHISLQRFARGPLKKRHQVKIPYTGFHPPRSRSMENIGRDSCGSLEWRVTHTQSIVTKGWLFMKNSYTEFHENPTNALVADTSQTDGPTSVSSHMRSQIFYKWRKVSPHIRRSHPWITNLPTKKKQFHFRLRPPFCAPLLFMKQVLRHFVQGCW